jgi:hypothetical protein
MKTVTLIKARQKIMASIPFDGSIVEIVSVMNDMYEMDCYMTEDEMISVEGPDDHIQLSPESFIAAVQHTIQVSGSEEIAEYYSYLTGKKYSTYREIEESDEHPETVLIMSGWDSGRK